MSYEKIVTLFNTHARAQQAVNELIQRGFDETNIDLLDKEQLQAQEKAVHERSIWDHLFGNDVVEEDSEVYSRAIKNNGVVLTLRTDINSVDQALSILEYHHNLDVIEHHGSPDATIAPSLHGSPNQAKTSPTRRYIIEQPFDTKTSLKEEQATIIRQAFDKNKSNN